MLLATCSHVLFLQDRMSAGRKTILSNGAAFVIPEHFYRSCFYIFCLVPLFNPFRTGVTFSSHENSPTNWPDSAALPAGFTWPARSRHTTACMHRFSHILRPPPVPAVWVMPEWRAVDPSRDEEMWGYTDHFQQFWNCYGPERVNPCGVLFIYELCSGVYTYAGHIS